MNKERMEGESESHVCDEQKIKKENGEVLSETRKRRTKENTQIQVNG